MAASAATAAIFAAVPLPSESGVGPKPSSAKLGSSNPDGCGIKTTKSGSSRGLSVKTNAQAPHKINGKSGDETLSTSSPPARTFINQLPDWSMLLAAITTIFLAAEKQWMMLDWKPKRPDVLIDPFGSGRIVQDGFVFRQNFSIRSYEIGADRTASIETCMNHLQETALNHVKTAGLLADGFGATPEMCKKNLIWVVTRMQVIVDRYPMWGDVVEVDTWVSASGKNGMRRDWLLRDSITGQTLTRASSVWVMMNKQTRRLSKMPDEVRAEIGQFFVDSPPLIHEDGRKLPKLDENTAEYIRTALSPNWNDLDMNQHVNNVKYVSWLLESTPRIVMEKHELSTMRLEYRRECGRDSTVESLTSVSNAGVGGLSDTGSMECQHMLRLEDGSEVVRATTEWRPKHVNNFGTLDQVRAASA